MKHTVDKIYSIEVYANKLIICIEDVLHIAIDRDELVGIQSWVTDMGPNKYLIEYYTKTTKIITEYDDVDKWKSILRLLSIKNIFIKE